ncbi:MAG: AbiJ-NTD4 domain-containing protein [Candidatus Binataceae bacterium]
MSFAAGELIMPRKYFTDRELGPMPRNIEEIPPPVWEALYDLIRSRSLDGSFARAYPGSTCDRPGISCTNSAALESAIRAHVPQLGEYERYETPPTFVILDLLEFAHDNLAEPTGKSSHTYFYEPCHHIESFDVAAGQEKFRDAVNLLFARNGLGYEMHDNGEIVRLGPQILREHLMRLTFNTGDGELDKMLENARTKFFDPNPDVRIEAVKVLWDAWERIKTLAGDKKSASLAQLLDTAAASRPQFRGTLETIARSLTDAGNNLMIRHSESGKEALTGNAQIDYLFHTLFAMIQLVLRENGKLAS